MCVCLDKVNQCHAFKMMMDFPSRINWGVGKGEGGTNSCLIELICNCPSKIIPTNKYLKLKAWKIHSLNLPLFQ